MTTLADYIAEHRAKDPETFDRAMAAAVDELAQEIGTFEAKVNVLMSGYDLSKEAAESLIVADEDRRCNPIAALIEIASEERVLPHAPRLAGLSEPILAAVRAGQPGTHQWLVFKLETAFQAVEDSDGDLADELYNEWKTWMIKHGIEVPA